MSRILFLNDVTRPYLHDRCGIMDNRKRIDSKIEIRNDAGDLIFEPLHNKTVIAGSALTAMKLFDLDRNSLDNTPTYETMLGGQ